MSAGRSVGVTLSDLLSIAEGRLPAVTAFGERIVKSGNVKAYRVRTRGVSGEKPTGWPAKTLQVERFPTARAVGPSRKEW